MSVLNELLTIPMDYSKPVSSFSPMYSNYAVCGDMGFAGVRTLILHYNRYTRALWNPFIRIPGERTVFEGRFDGITVETDQAKGRLSFYDKDAFVFSCTSTQAIEFFCQPDAGLADHWVAEQKRNSIIIQGYTPRGDERDPDSQTAVLNGMKVLRGKLYIRRGHYFVEPDDEGKIYVAIAASVMKISGTEIKNKLESAPTDIAMAEASVHKWAQGCIGDRIKLPDGEREKEVFLRAISGLLMNLTKAPGYLKGHISSFPNRGGYPTQFLWDSAFQNLGYELMNPDIAKDAILQLTDNIRLDGKIYMFLSSTWTRPEYSQPALIGWMTIRYLDVVGNKDEQFMRKMLSALEANNEWWLQQRMTRFGLIFCEHGLESGQDDSPRFDGGSILALDMNSYLVNQMRCTAELARRLGKTTKEKIWEKRADQLAALIVEYLYDPFENMFFDASAETGERRPLITTSAFLPLWCGVPLEKEKIDRMIRDWLLNPDRLFGKIPFPCVAYDQPCYNPGSWWRGPTWMPLAWIMLEVLEKYGFTEARCEAVQRLYDMLLKDGELHELFNSQTGEGLCNTQQGWTAAIYLRLGQELLSQSRSSK